jgi:hypothetical protein
MAGLTARREYMAKCFWPGVTSSEMAEVDVRPRHEAAWSASDQVVLNGSHLVAGDEVS